MAGKRGGELRLAFVRQKRAGDEHQPPARFQPAKGAVEKGCLQGHQPGDFGAVFDKGQVRMPTNGARGRAGPQPAQFDSYTH